MPFAKDSRRSKTSHVLLHAWVGLWTITDDPANNWRPEEEDQSRTQSFYLVASRNLRCCLLRERGGDETGRGTLSISRLRGDDEKDDETPLVEQRHLVSSDMNLSISSLVGCMRDTCIHVHIYLYIWHCDWPIRRIILGPLRSVSRSLESSRGKKSPGERRIVTVPRRETAR